MSVRQVIALLLTSWLSNLNCYIHPGSCHFSCCNEPCYFWLIAFEDSLNSRLLIQCWLGYLINGSPWSRTKRYVIEENLTFTTHRYPCWRSEQWWTVLHCTMVWYSTPRSTETDWPDRKRVAPRIDRPGRSSTPFSPPTFTINTS